MTDPKTTTDPATGWQSLPWDAAAVHFHEIGLKGGNRLPFTKRLRDNLEKALASQEGRVKAFHDRLLLTAPPGRLPACIAAARRVFGVQYVAPVQLLEPDIEAMSRAAVALYRAAAAPGASFAVRARRADKRFAMTSAAIGRRLGHDVQAATGAPVDLSAPEVVLSVRVHAHSVYLEGPHLAGPGGLPMGVTGKVLTLFSGGIDSPVAAWLMMKRGCRSSFLHVHTFPDAEAVRGTKIPGLVEDLIKPQGYSERLYLVPYHPFEMALLQAAVPPEMELILFRRHIVRVADAVARKARLAALVTGDNLAQVASQTMENLAALQGAAQRPVFRPLLTMNKPEIVAAARHIGTYERSLLPYKDCCSIVSRRPATRPRLRRVLDAEKALDIEALARETLDALVEWMV